MSTCKNLSTGLVALAVGSLAFVAGLHLSKGPAGCIFSKIFGSSKVPKKIKISYFDIQGVAEKLRLALILKGIEFEDDRINFKDWAQKKSETKFGVLPEVAFDGNIYGQSDACLKYIASLPGKEALVPSSNEEKLKLDEILGVAGDLDRAWMSALYCGMRPQEYGYAEGYHQTEDGKANTKALRTKFLTDKLPIFMKYYETFLGENDFICGNKLTIADCVILPQLSKFSAGFIDYVPTDTLNKYPKIVAYLERLKNVPAIKAWYTK